MFATTPRRAKRSLACFSASRISRCEGPLLTRAAGFLFCAPEFGFDVDLDFEAMNDCFALSG